MPASNAFNGAVCHRHLTVVTSFRDDLLEFAKRSTVSARVAECTTERDFLRMLYKFYLHILSFLPARRYASAGNSDRNVSVCPPVRPSVTRRYCVKTKKASDMVSSPSGSLKTLVF